MSLQFNSVSLRCSICRNDCPASTGIFLVNCRHVFCYDCISNCVKSNPGDIKTCPFINKKYKCNAILQMYELDSLNSDNTKTLIENAKKDVWNCPKCQLENNLSTNECKTCKEPRLCQPNELNQYIQCINCFDTCNRTRIYTLPECKHNICNNCLIVYLKHQTKDYVDKVHCPIRHCNCIMNSRDTLEIFMQLDRFYIDNVLNVFDVCVSCQVEHANVTCNQFQNNLQFSNDPTSVRLKGKYEQLVNTEDATNCPNCQLVIVKQGKELECCFSCDLVFKPEYLSKPWQCNICYSLNERASHVCEVCGRSLKSTSVNNMVSTARCMFCTLEINFVDGVTLNCSHIFCKECLEFLMIDNEVVYKCPYEQNNNKCASPIEEYEILEIMGTQKYKRRHIRLIRDVAKKNEKCVVCFDENCIGWSLKEDLPFESIMYNCAVCNQLNCLTCRVVHTGITCPVYKDSLNCDQFIQPASQLYYDLIKMDNDEMIKNTEPFTCGICYVEFGVGEAIVLRECLHMFCKNCITEHVRHTDGVEAMCPYRNEDYTCESIILEREIKAIVDEKTYNQYIERWFTIGKNNIKNGVQCKTVNCNGFWINDEKINEQKCPVCNAINCLNCQAIHPGLSCDEYQPATDTMERLEKDIARGIGMRCPKCEIIIVRNEGCHWLQCAMCRTEICWITKGARWGPNGPGDISGGCRCNVDGIKCHPDCGNCH